jgi:hypothetical protein
MDDLALSTQGRSLWILDDVTPLRQLAAAPVRAAAHLYTPRDAYRVNAAGPGREESAPEPRPQGALLHYYLADSATSPITLEVLDARGTVVRAFTSDTALARERALPALPVKRGMHRIVWDLTYPGPRPVKGAVLWGYTGGVKAPPGAYQVRLTAAGVTETRPFRVLADRRFPFTQGDYEEQFRVASQVRDSMNAIAQAIETLRSVKEQAARAVEQAARVDRAAELRPISDSLAAKLGAVEERLIQTRSRSGQDPIRFAGRLDNQFAELYGNVTGTDGYIAGGAEGRPTKGAFERLTDLNAEWAPLAARLRAILETDVPAFNAAVVRAGVAPVTVPVRRPITSM